MKGHGLATEGYPQNHSSLLTQEQMRSLAVACGTDLDDPWAPFTDGSPEAALCSRVAAGLRRPAVPSLPEVWLPSDMGRTPSGRATTQAALGRALLDVSRAAPQASARVVTVSPDVSSSTNLGGWVNKVGVWAPIERQDWFADDAETILHWREQPTGQHLELGIAEVNLVSLLGELGANLEPVGRCCPSAWSTTRSSGGPWSRGRSACTPAGSRSWSGRRPG